MGLAQKPFRGPLTFPLEGPNKRSGFSFRTGHFQTFTLAAFFESPNARGEIDRIAAIKRY
jgi:hypothetical protein